MHRFLSTLILGATLIAPVSMKADDDHHDKVKIHRYYDRDAKDWHEWNEHENRAYRRYWEEKRERQREWARLKREQQRDYWRWRHRHPETFR